jgi:hypothetical protein
MEYTICLTLLPFGRGTFCTVERNVRGSVPAVEPLADVPRFLLATRLAISISDTIQRLFHVQQ